MNPGLPDQWRTLFIYFGMMVRAFTLESYPKTPKMVRNGSLLDTQNYGRDQG